MSSETIACIILCVIVIIACGVFSTNLTGYYELDQETKLIRAMFFILAIGCAIVLGELI